jgi:hypothetical protein
MANYAVVDWTYGPATAAEVAAALETKLETLDSTTNPIQLIDILPVARDRDLCIGILIYDG